MDKILAYSTFALVVSTTGLAAVTLFQLLESRRASKRQMGFQTWLEFRKWFDSPELIAARRELAKLIRAYTPERHKEIPETVMNFFEDLGTLYILGYMDTKLADDTFSYYAVRWWEALKGYVDYERKRHNEDNTLFANFEKLAAKMRQPEDVLDADEMKLFLADENNLVSK